MAPRKVKNQGKKNKIKSKAISQKRVLKPVKKTKVSEKPLENLKWLNKIPNDRPIKKCNGAPDWLNSTGYKHGVPRRSSEADISDYADYPPKDGEEKSTISDASEECNCSHAKYAENKGGILKRKNSSTNSLVAKYIKSGMNHVASFIVESAIRFGEQHGVVVPDKNSPNVYEITPPDRFDEKCRKIRFKIPDKALAYENDKKVMWRSHRNSTNNGLRGTSPLINYKKKHMINTTSCEGSPDSLEEILPLLKKLKDGGEKINSDLDLSKLTDDEGHNRKMERDRNRHRNRDRDRDRDRDRERGRERERDRERGRVRERLREKFQSLGKRYKSLDAVSDKVSEENEYEPSTKNPWKKFRRDSLELGRQRLRASTCPRKQESRSPSPY